MRVRCQQVYPGLRQCRRWSLSDSQWCRWHRILQEYRADWKGSPERSRSLMFGAGTDLALGAVGIWMFLHRSEMVWLLLGLWALGWSAMLFSDSVIALDYPLSQFTIWPKALAGGMAAAALCGFGSAIYLAIVPRTAEPVLALISQKDGWLLYGPSLLIAVLAWASATPLKMFIHRVLFRNPPLFDGTVMLATMCLASAALHPLLQRVSPVDPHKSQEFWRTVLGQRSGWVLAIAYFVAFNACEIVNVRMRRRHGSQRVFEKTYEASLPVCMMPPMLAMVISRFVLLWLDVSSSVLFVILTLLLSLPVCILTTRWLIRWGWRSMESSSRSAAGAR